MQSSWAAFTNDTTISVDTVEGRFLTTVIRFEAFKFIWTPELIVELITTVLSASSSRIENWIEKFFNVKFSSTVLKSIRATSRPNWVTSIIPGADLFNMEVTTCQVYRDTSLVSVTPFLSSWATML
jgi:hypothetical protein